VTPALVRALLLLLAVWGAGAAGAAGTRALGADILTLSDPALARDVSGHKYSMRAITDQRHLAELGHVSAQYNLGVMFGVNGRERAAMHWYRKAALRGHREASYNLGVLNLEGRGLPPDPAEAFRWFSAAAERGLPQAHHRLGRMYYAGQGVPRDLALERDHYLRAAEGGYANAQYDLGVLLHLGEGGPRDEVEAFAWFTVAEAGGIDCREALAAVRAELSPQQLTEATARAADLLERHAPP
jgi:hypothetical protein